MKKSSLKLQDLDLIIIAALRWNISSRMGDRENTAAFLLANWYHPHIIARHRLYLRDLNEESDFWQRVDEKDRDFFRILHDKLEPMPTLPANRWQRKVRTKGLGQLTLDALMYSMGRASYMPGAIMDFLRANWQHPELQARRAEILSALKTWLDTHCDDPLWCYRDQWKATYDTLQQTDKPRKGTHE